MAHNRTEIIREITLTALDEIVEENEARIAAGKPIMTTAEVQDKIITDVRTEIELENAILPKGSKMDKYNSLAPAQVAWIIARLHPVKLIVTANAGSDGEYALLGVYQDSGEKSGIYDTSEKAVRDLARTYNALISIHDVKEMIAVLRDAVDTVYPCNEKNLIAVNNGIFDYDTKQLLPFTPEKVFLSKCKVNYNPVVQNITIHNDEDGTDWDVESWMNSLSDDAEVVNTLWEVIGAIVRPLVPWNRSAWFYSEKGNNGKGTLCELMRELCGDGTYVSIPLAEMGKDFMLEPLTHASAIIVDENDVGTFIDKAANLKAIITGDVIQINRKFKIPVSYKFRGFMVQCLNEMPRIKDKSDSFFRRQLFIPFTKCFTGIERKYIKQDYLHRQEVLEYVLYKVLNMNYYELSTPEVCEEALKEYKEYNDPIRQFANDILPNCVWDLLPFCFLYDLYREWYSVQIPTGSPEGNRSFIKNLKQIVDSDFGDKWEEVQENVKEYMNKPEPLVREYGLIFKWGNPRYIASYDDDKACVPVHLQQKYRGLLRKKNNI